MIGPDLSTEKVPLPAELLIYIFELATENPLREIDALVELQPFESLYKPTIEERCDAALKTKRSLTLTCSTFRRLCTVFLYEDIRVRHGSGGLRDVLEQSRGFPDSGLGTFVKRAVLSPVDSHGTMSSTDMVCSDTRRILSCCPNIQIICRPRDTIFKTSDDSLPEKNDISPCSDLNFSSLRRVDWFDCCYDNLPVAAQLPQSVWSSTSLHTLSVDAGNWSSGVSTQETITIRLNMHALRVSSLDMFGVSAQRLYSLELPFLQRLIFDKPESTYALFGIVAYGDQVTTLELGQHIGFLAHDYIAILLVYFPNATELLFPVFTTCATQNTSEASFVSSVTRVGLNAAMDQELDWDEETKWEQLASHFEALCGQGSEFGKLEHITLYGAEWRELVDDPRIGPSLQLLRSKGIELSGDDKETESMLKLLSFSMS